MDFKIDLFKKSFDFLPIGLRVNNPGCIRYSASNCWKGQQGSYRGFCRFESFEYGVRAITLLLCRYMHKYRLFDVESMMERYAPYRDGNFPRVYADTIAKLCGVRSINKDIRLMKIELPLVIFSIFKVENGSEYSNRSYDKEYCNYLLGLISKYIDEYLEGVVYPGYGKVTEL